MIALGARVVQEVGDLWRSARKADKHLATLAIDTEIRFASAAKQGRIHARVDQAVAELASRYRDDAAPGGRPHRLVILAHPTPTTGKD